MPRQQPAGFGGAADNRSMDDPSTAGGAAFAGQALLLAAGRGERMRPLTDHCPKPLLPVAGKPLMQWAMEQLARGGVQRLVVNTAWLGSQISAHFGTRFETDGAPPQAIRYSEEGRDFGRALETAGGIVRALPLLEDVFWVLAGDVHAPGFAFAPAQRARLAEGTMLAHLWLVPNPEHNPRGDFGLAADGRALNQSPDRYPFSTIGLYRRALFAAPYCGIAPGNPDGVALPLAPLLRSAIDDGRVSAELYRDAWTDVGTPERWRQLAGG